MQILNSSFQTTDRAGNVLDGASLSGFVDSFAFADLGSPEWFDPHVIYDSLHGRWLMTMAGLTCGATATAVRLRDRVPLLRDLRHVRPDRLLDRRPTSSTTTS